MNIILDTNLLMTIAQFKVDIFSELQRVCPSHIVTVLTGTVKELEKIKKTQRGKHKTAAGLALQLITKKKLNQIKSDGFVDDILIEYSKKGVLVATLDIRLKRRLQKPYLTLRKKQYLVLIE